MNLLVTGFEPFAGLSHNPSSALLEPLPQHLQHHQIIVPYAVLPGGLYLGLGRLHNLRHKQGCPNVR